MDDSEFKPPNRKGTRHHRDCLHDETGVTVCTCNPIRHRPVPPAKKYVERGRENDLTDEMLENMDADSSWHGFVDMGGFRSIDGELSNARTMQNHIPRLVAEIRRLRELVPDHLRVAPPPPRYQPPPMPIPKPPFEYPWSPK